MRQGFLGGCSAIPLLHLKSSRILNKSVAARVARQGFPAHVCNYGIAWEREENRRLELVFIFSQQYQDVWANAFSNSHLQFSLSVPQGLRGGSSEPRQALDEICYVLEAAEGATGSCQSVTQPNLKYHRAARLQNEIAPNKLLIRYEKGSDKRKK